MTLCLGFKQPPTRLRSVYWSIGSGMKLSIPSSIYCATLTCIAVSPSDCSGCWSAKCAFFWIMSGLTCGQQVSWFYASAVSRIPSVIHAVQAITKEVHHQSSWSHLLGFLYSLMHLLRMLPYQLFCWGPTLLIEAYCRVCFCVLYCHDQLRSRPHSNSFHCYSHNLPRGGSFLPHYYYQ